MQPSLKTAAGLLTWYALCLFSPLASRAQSPSSVRRVQVLHNQNQVEIEIEASDRLVPQTLMLTGPDRLVVDFANAVPGAQLRNQAVNRGEVKSVRVGLFSSKPPVTRVVLDLNGPQRYQVFPNGRTVIVKVGAGAGTEAGLMPTTGPASGHALEDSAEHSLELSPAAGRSQGFGLVNATYPVPARITPPPAIPVKPPLVVWFRNGLLTINSNKASLSEILFAVHQRTGAEIAIPAGAEQEQVVDNLGPAPAPEVLAHLLNGSRFNFLILSSSSKPGALDRVILSPRSDALMPLPPVAMPQAQARNQPPEEDVDSDPPSAAPPPNPNPQQPPQMTPDGRVQSAEVPD